MNWQDEWREDRLWQNRRTACRDHGTWTDDFGTCLACEERPKERRKTITWEPGTKREKMEDLGFRTEQEYIDNFKKIQSERMGE